MLNVPIVDDRFELHSVAGRGGMGVVYRATDRALGREVAVKILQASDAESCERFLREALLLATMAHPGIVRHVAHGYTASGEPYLAMEWLSGEDLSERLQRGRLSVDETVHLGSDIAESLAYAHGQGVVHRDLKPANVFLLGRDLSEVRLLDFGIAHLQSGESHATRTGTVIGTPAYMAPEQARGERGLDGRADLFSLGCVLYECLTGRAPFVASSAMAVLIKVLLEEPPPLSELRRELPPGLVRLVEQLLSKDPADRLPSAAAAKQALGDVVLLQEPAESAAAPLGLTQSERRVVTLLVVANPWPNSVDATEAQQPTRRNLVAPDDMTTVVDLNATVAELEDGATLQVVPMGPLLQLQRRLGAIGLRLHRLLDGTLLALAPSRATPSEQAALAAEGALLLRERIPKLTAVITTGYGTSNAQDGGEVAIGAAIEAAAEALRGLVEANTGIVALDDNTLSLLGDRFGIDAAVGLPPPFAWRLGLGQQQVRGKHLLLGKPTPLAGRGRELAIFRALFDCLKTEGGTKVLVTGDPGYGKSRLLEEFAQWVEQHHRTAQVWRLRSEAGAQDSPYASLASLMAQTAGLQAGMSDAERTQRVRVRIARLVPTEQREAVMDLARAALGINPGGASQRLRAAREDSSLMADLVRDGFAAWLRAEAGQAPLLVVVDDLQWIDAPSLHAIRLVHDAVTDEAALFIGVARSEIYDRFTFLRGNARVWHVHLGPLSARASREVITAVLGERVDAEQIENLTRLSAGEPYYLEELLRAVATGKQAQATTLLAMAQARIDALSTDGRRVLRAAAIFGMRCWSEGLAALIGGAVRQQLRELATAEILMPADRNTLHGQHELVFRQASLRDAAYASLTDGDRQLGHRLAGQFLQQAGETDAVVLARHFDLGLDGERAQMFYGIAAENALSAHDYAAARRWVDRGLQFEQPGESRARLHLAQADLSMAVGQPMDALVTAQAAAEGFQPGTRHWYRAMAEIGRALVYSAQLLKIGPVVQAFLRPVPEPASIESAVFAAARLAVNVMFVDQIGPADELIAFAEALQQRADPPIGVAARARLAGASSSRLALHGDLGGALRATQAALDGFAKIDDRRNAASQQLDIGVLLVRIGDHVRGEEAVGMAIGELQSLGLSGSASVGKIWLGIARLRAGRDVQAQALLEAAATELEGGVALTRSWAQAGLVHLYQRRGDFDKADTALQLLQNLVRTAPPMWTQAMGQAAELRLAQGRLPEALELAKNALQIWREGVPSPERGMRTHMVLAEVLLATGQPAEGLAAAQQGLDAVAWIRRSLHDPQLEASFDASEEPLRLGRVALACRTAVLSRTP